MEYSIGTEDNPDYGKIPSISAVIVNFNGGNCIIKCVEALYRQKVPLESIIVVDSGSTDGSPDLVRRIFPYVKLFEMKEDRGLPEARNLGLRLATTDLVLMIDDDMYVAEDSIIYLIKSYLREQSTVICPRIVLFPELDIIQADGANAHFLGTMVIRNGYLRVEDADPKAANVDGCLGGCFMVHRNRVLEAGGFDSAYFFYLEDLEFSIRLRSLGYKIFFEPSAIVYHDRGSGTLGLSFRGQGKYPARRAYLLMRNRLMTILIHYKARTLAVVMPALALYELACLLTVLLRGWGAEWVKAWHWQLVNLRSILKRRRRVQRERVLNDRELLVGGPLPMAPGFARSQIENAAITTLSTIFDAYWRITRKWVG